MLKLTRLALLLSLAVVILGAYTRLTEAGLGCPDWPGCYGHLKVPHDTQIATAQARFPEQPIEVDKAWNEMIHRYFAGALGMFITALLTLAWRRQSQQKNQFNLKILRHTLLLFALVVFQALLGMWTVTLMLMPLVVMGHLLGGFSIVILLLLLERRLVKPAEQQPHLNSAVKKTLPSFAWLALVLLVVQIALGGWTAANYAATACTQLPICEGNWKDNLQISEAFSLPPEAQSYQYGVLSYEARATIHIFHRFGAVLTFIFLLLWFGRLALPHKPQLLRLIAQVGMGLLAIQVSLGIANVVLALPLAVAVLHNAVALLLLATLVLSLYYRRQTV
ncbi:COX15/CtaA family protein [Gayadomonas joobiniege]|uniref:COX15/CtaA family protein n=1 Tax=Gayadomonas joobiniege TaxID=1234606 RepID=UPI000365E7A0|nr:COX15/CtaA family protein [Gayadomonas joobiniege]